MLEVLALCLMGLSVQRQQSDCDRYVHQVVRLKKLAGTLAIWARDFYRVGYLKVYLFAKHFAVLRCNSVLMYTYVIASN